MKKAVTFVLIATIILTMPIAALAGRSEDVTAFLMTRNDWFAPENITAVKNQLMGATDAKFQAAIAAEYRDPDMMLIWAVIGIDRFFLDDTLMGILKVITGGGFGIWTIIDLFSIKQRTHAYNFKLLNSFN